MEVKFMLMKNSIPDTLKPIYSVSSLDEIVTIISKEYHSYPSNAERNITELDILIDNVPEADKFKKHISGFPFVVKLKGSNLNFPVGYLTHQI